MTELEIIWEEARGEVRNFAEDTGILTDWEKVEEDPRLLSGEMDEVNLLEYIIEYKYKYT